MNPAALRSRQKNTLAIIRYIIKCGEVSRTSIAAAFGLSTATVTNIVSELIRDDILYESGKTGSAFGRKAKLLKFNARRNYTVAVDIGDANYMEVYLCDLLGNIEHRQKFNISFLLTEDNPDALILDQIITSLSRFINRLTSEEEKKIKAIAVSIPGIVNGDSTIYAPFYNWKNLPLIKPLRAAFPYPVYFENVTRIKSVYELSYLDPSERNVIYLALSPGIGMVHFFGGAMIQGRHGLAGEVGHMILNTEGPLCYCGNRGCFELYCAENALIHAAEALLNGEDTCDILQHLVHTKKYPLSVETLIEARNLGSLKVHHIFSQVAFYLGCALTSLLNCYDPDRIIISGNLIDLDDYVFNTAIEEAKSKIVNRFAREVKISKAHLETSHIERAICTFVLNKIVDTLI